jgi:hypothetical protein
VFICSAICTRGGEKRQLSKLVSGESIGLETKSAMALL